MIWPPPPPGRPEWAWLLQLPPRGWILRRLIRPGAATVPDGGLVVSVGGGPGFEFREVERLRPRGVRWRGLLLDAQLAMLTQARRPGRPAARANGPDVALGDAVALPLRDASVDLVLSLGVLCCMTDEGADAAAREAWRVLRPGGYAVLSVPRWRGAADESRHTKVGFVRVGGGRPGRAVFRKRI